MVFCPFAVGYFLSIFFRHVTAVISRDLALEFALTPADLGFLTSMYLLTFAAFQLPLGVLLDRYGPRRTVATLMCFAAAGALVFALAKDLTTLSVGRALIGLGVSGGLMGAIKAFSVWFPKRLATVNGIYLAAGGLGSLSATAPAEWLAAAYGWRAMFWMLGASSLAAAALVYFVVPERTPPSAGQTLRTQVAAFRGVFSSVVFWRVALPYVIGQSIYTALQGLWFGPWLGDVGSQDRQSVANYLFVSALGYVFGSAFFGVASDRLSRMVVYKVGLSISLVMLVLIAAGVQTGLAAILALYAFTGISSALCYAILTPLFPPEMTGRMSTASNMLMFGLSFALQWGIGAVLRLYPVVDGHYSATGYTVAFATLALAQLLAIAWLLPMKSGSGSNLRKEI